MKCSLLLMNLLITIIGSAFNDTGPGPGIPQLLNKQQYEESFPHHHAIYTYENFVAAAESFPLFANDGSEAIRKKELAAFFANIAHETTGGWAQSPGGPYAWGLFYVEEQACKDGHCVQYNTAGSGSYQPVPGKSYHGRGPLQLTYAYNYGLAGEDLHLPLLQQPELVSTDGIIAFKTAIWFWMREQKPKPSCHNVICGNWQPTEEDARQNRKPGFGMVINIINGGVECNSSDPSIQSKRKERIDFYKWFAGIMKVTVEEDCDCNGMGTYGL